MFSFALTFFLSSQSICHVHQGEVAKERADHEHLTPCLKYCWETYRCTLDLLKNNARMDDLYQVGNRLATLFLFEFSWRRNQRDDITHSNSYPCLTFKCR